MTDLAKANEVTCSRHGDKCPDICQRCRHSLQLHLNPPDGCLQAGCACRQFIRADTDRRTACPDCGSMEEVHLCPFRRGPRM